VINGIVIPLWVSIPAAFISGCLSILLMRMHFRPSP
jgi:hypothetical protein